MTVIATLDGIVTSIGSRGALGQENACTISAYQQSTFVAKHDVHLVEPVIMERVAVDFRRVDG